MLALRSSAAAAPQADLLSWSKAGDEKADKKGGGDKKTEKKRGDEKKAEEKGGAIKETKEPADGGDKGKDEGSSVVKEYEA